MAQCALITRRVTVPSSLIGDECSLIARERESDSDWRDLRVAEGGSKQLRVGCIRGKRRRNVIGKIRCKRKWLDVCELIRDLMPLAFRLRHLGAVEQRFQRLNLERAALGNHDFSREWISECAFRATVPEKRRRP